MATGFVGRLRRVTPARLFREARAQLRRAGKWWRARATQPRDTQRVPVFVVGCHRSGTNMLMWTLERSPSVWVYHEHVWNRAFRNYRLRSTETIDALIRRSPAPVVAFKPVCEAHLTDRLLERHSGARAVWIYRHYDDVVNSALRNWAGHHRDVVRWIVGGDSDWLGWRGERLPPDVVETLRSLFHEGLSHEDGAALMWWLRNRFFFDLELDSDGRVLLVNYEALVSGRGFGRLFEFVGATYEPDFHAHVVPSSVGKHSRPALAPAIEDLCEELLGRFEGSLARQAAGGTAPSGIAQAR